ncbi:MAG: Gfo/Idh/MocA family oxidoreductase [Armatimonadetes bacterium]|nr:Gfo/Idh/MocA family oxidoreductase [Armatimonadota bacterium]
MASDKVQVGVVGVGIGRTHLNGYRKLGDRVEIFGICDINEARARATADEFGVKRVFTDYAAMFAEPDLDAVSVCTPNALHAEVALAAIEAGKHVLCEKPMADTLENAQKIVAASRRSDKVFMMGMNNRFRGDTQVLKSFINEGQLGDIYYAKCGWTRRNGIPGLGGWFTTRAMSGGGPLIDIGVHVLDLTTYLMGNPAPVSASGSTYAHFGPRGRGAGGYGYAPDPGTKIQYDVEDLATGLVKFDNGATLFLEASWASYIPHDQFYSTLLGTEGGADLEPLRVYKDMAGAPVDIAPQAPQIGGHEAEVRHFIECIEQNKTPLATAEQGLHILQILDAIYRSAETGREVVIAR